MFTYKFIIIKIFVLVFALITFRVSVFWFVGPISVEDEVDVDVVDCSDSEEAPPAKVRRLHHTSSHNNNNNSNSHNHNNSSSSQNHLNSSTTSSQGRSTPPQSPGSDTEERLTPEPVQKTPKIVGSCNCDELKPVQCHLETKELWDRFHELGTEMIITKTGRYVHEKEILKNIILRKHKLVYCWWQLRRNIAGG